MPYLAVPISSLSFPDWFQSSVGAPTHNWAKLLYFGLSPATRSTYNTAIKSYVAFVATTFPGGAPWPAQLDMICQWTAHRLCGIPGERRVAASTMELYIAALRSYHVDHMFDTTVFSSDTLRRIIKGALHLYGKTSEPRLPISRDILAKLCARQPTSKGEANMRACWLLAFAGFWLSLAFCEWEKLLMTTKI